MKKILPISLLILALVLGSMQVAPVSAQSFPNYQSSIQVQNMGTSPVVINFSYYKSDGTLDQNKTFSDPTAIPVGQSRSYFPILGASSGFSGSAVITSSGPVAAISNILGRGATNAIIGAASYTALSTGSTKIGIPLLMKGNSGYNTWISIQNTSNATATVTIKYSDLPAVTASIPAFSQKSFNQRAEPHTQKVFSAVVTSPSPLAVSVFEENPTTLFAYTGFPDEQKSTSPIIPLVNANNSGWQTGIQIQNVGSASASVTVNYKPGPGTGRACTETQTIPAGQSKTYALNAFAGVPLAGMTTTCAAKVRFVGSATVTSTVPLQIIVNQLKATSGGAYNVVNPTSATKKVIFPLVMDRNGPYFTGFNIVNVGSSPTNIHCTFQNSSTVFDATNVPAGGSVNHIQLNKLTAGYIGSAMCVSSATNILGQLNEATTYGNNDGLLVYEGINIP